jgi:hypothetical protein
MPLDECDRDEIRAASREWARRTAVEQGFPEKITDPAVIEQVAALARPSVERKEDSWRPTSTR